MDFLVSEFTAISSWTIKCKITMQPSLMREFCFVLESIDGLGIHSSTTDKNVLNIFFPISLIDEFNMYLSSFRNKMHAPTTV